MKKTKILVLIFFLYSFQCFQVFSDDKIAFIDVDFIIKNSNVGKNVLKNINQLDQKNIKILKERNKELKEKEVELKNKKNILSEEEFKKQFNDLKKKINIYTNEKNLMVKNFNKFKKDELDKIFKKIGPIVSNYMEANSIDIVLDSKNMFMGNSKSDITKNILDEINKSLN